MTTTRLSVSDVASLLLSAEAVIVEQTADRSRTIASFLGWREEGDADAPFLIAGPGLADIQIPRTRRVRLVDGALSLPGIRIIPLQRRPQPVVPPGSPASLPWDISTPVGAGTAISTLVQAAEAHGQNSDGIETTLGDLETLAQCLARAMAPEQLRAALTAFAQEFGDTPEYEAIAPLAA